MSSVSESAVDQKFVKNHRRELSSSLKADVSKLLLRDHITGLASSMFDGILYFMFPHQIFQIICFQLDLSCCLRDFKMETKTLRRQNLDKVRVN